LIIGALAQTEKGLKPRGFLIQSIAHRLKPAAIHEFPFVLDYVDKACGNSSIAFYGFIF